MPSLAFVIRSNPAIIIKFIEICQTSSRSLNQSSVTVVTHNVDIIPWLIELNIDRYLIPALENTSAIATRLIAC